MYTTREIYKKIKALNEKVNLSGEITSTEYTQYLKCIKTELESSRKEEWETAMQTLQILVDHNVQSVRSDVLDIIEDEEINPNMQESILVSVSIQCLQQYLKEYSLGFVGKLYEISKKHNIDFSANLKTVLSLDVYRDCCKHLIYNVLIPTIFDKNKLESPDNLVYLDLALVFASALPFSCWQQQELQTFIDNIPSRVNVICELHNSNFNDWYKLWMFLVRFSGIKLHSSMSAINKLLRAAETAFRNSSNSERIKGYECWKELIINASLDLKYMTSTKQLKLLLTPLKAKFSKQEVVVLKKFEVYVLLIEKLQYKAVLVLKDFLEFCFGQVSENTDPNKSGFGKTVPGLSLRMSKVFLAILGHSHSQDEKCLDSSTEINLKLAVLNSNNFIEYAEHVIKSMAECCLCLKVVEVANETNTALKCLWKSLLNLVLHNDAREVCYPFIGKVLDKFLQNSDPYSATLSAIAFQEIVANESPNRASLVLNQLDSLLSIVFTVPLTPECGSKVEDLLTVLRGVDSAEEGEMQTKLFKSFVNHQTTKSNVNFVADIWCFVVNSTKDYVKAGSLDLLIWPIRYVHLITDKSKEVSVYKHKAQLMLFVEESDDLHLALFKQFEKTLKNNPLLIGNVLEVLTEFQPKIKNKEITNVTLDLLIFMLLIPLTDEIAIHHDRIESYMKKLFENGLLEIYEFDSIKKICTCVELLLILKSYDVVDYLGQTFAAFPENVKLAYSKNLNLVTLTNIFDDESIEKQIKIHKIITALRNVKASESKKNLTSVMTVGGRSAKIASLVKQLPPSTVKPDTNQSPLRLFGKDIETHTPLKPVAGSQRNKSTPNKSTPVSKPNSASKIKPLIDEESSSKFVLIDSEVKLDKTKLTEHQKEVLTKRREDIPALYQDLSQSVSQSFDSSEAFAAKPDTTNQNKEVDEKTLGLQKKKFEAEMRKLSMNIVGADQFLSPGTKRKRSSSVFENDPKRKAKEPSGTPGEKTRRPRRSKTPKSKMTQLEQISKSNPTSDSEVTQKKPPRSRSKSNSSLTEKKNSVETFLCKRSASSNFPVTAEDDFETELFGSEANLQDTSKDTSKTSNEPEENIAKRKLHLSGSEEDDVIESSQDTTLPNSRWSLNKTRRNSSTDTKPIDQSAKENSDDLNYITVRRSKKGANPMMLKQDEEKLTPVVNLENINLATRIEDRKSVSSEKRARRRTESVERRKSPRTQNQQPQQCNEVTKKVSLTFICTNSETKQEPETSKDTDTTCDLDLTAQTLSQVDLINETQTEPTKLVTDNETHQKSTQSQDTETIGTELLETDQEAVLPMLDLPQKLPLTESEQDMAEMDTASFTSVHSSECTVIKKNETSSQETECAEVNAEIRLTRCDDVQTEEVESQVLNQENEMSVIKDLLVLGKCEGVVEDVLSPHKRMPVENCAATPDRLQASLPSSPVTVDTPNRTSELLTSTSDISPIASTQSSSDEEEPKKLVPIVLNFDCDEDEPQQKSPEKQTENNQDDQAILLPSKNEEVPDIAERFKDTLCKKIVRSRGFRSIGSQKCRSILSPSASRIKKLMSKFKPNSKTESLEEYRKEDVLTFSREVPSPLAIPRSSILKRKHPDTPEDGTSPCAKRKRVNFSDPCISSKKLFIREEALPLSCDLDEVSDSDIDQQLLDQEKNDVSTSNFSVTQNDNSIYPPLVDCEENVHDFLKWGFEGMDNNLRSKLNEGNIKTVGDLAKQSEISIEKLSIPTREQFMLVEMLDSYHKKNCLDRTKVNGNKELETEGSEMESPLDLAKRMLQKIDIKLELDQTIEKVKRQGIPMDTLFSVVLGSANQTEVLTWVKSHFCLQTADLLEEKDFPSALQHITDSLGFEEVFKSLEKISKAQYNATIGKCLQETPLSDIVATRSAQELSTVLLEDRNIHIKKEIVENFSRQASSAELSPFFSQLRLQEMVETIQNRLSEEGYVDFIKTITNSSENVKETVLDQCSDSELIAKLLKRRSVESVTSELFDQLTTEEKKDTVVFLVKRL